MPRFYLQIVSFFVVHDPYKPHSLDGVLLCVVREQNAVLQGKDRFAVCILFGGHVRLRVGLIFASRARERAFSTPLSVKPVPKVSFR